MKPPTLFQTLATVLAMRDAPIQAHIWQISRGVHIFPEGKCPFCKNSIRSSQIWWLGPGEFKGRWRIVRRSAANQLRFTPPILNDDADDHPHVFHTDVCLGNNRGDNATENALFLGMNPGGAYSAWAGNVGVSAAQERWDDFLSSVWNHECDQIESWFESEFPDENGDENGGCDICQHGLIRCDNQSPDDDWECDRYEGHAGNHVACMTNENIHYCHEWPNVPAAIEAAVCNCTQDDFCNDHTSDGWVCSRQSGHTGQHRACQTFPNGRHQLCPDWGEPEEIPTEIPLRYPGVCLCVAREFWCQAQEDVENGSFYCSRARGHIGQHRACAGGEHNLAPDWGEPEAPSVPNIEEILRSFDSTEDVRSCTPENRTCVFDGARSCDEYSRATGQRWWCSREFGHDGPHIACGGEIPHNIEIWESRNEPF